MRVSSLMSHPPSHTLTQCSVATISNIYSTVRRSTADIYNRGVVFTDMQSAKVNMLAEVGCRGYRLT